jgi:hypothetical protein
MLQLDFAIDVSGGRVLVSFVCYDPLVSDLARVLLDLSISPIRVRGTTVA